MICKVCRAVNDNNNDKCFRCGASLHNQKDYIKQRNSAARQKQYDQYIQNKLNATKSANTTSTASNSAISNGNTSSNSANTMRCKYCNKQISRNSYRCPFCGRTVGVEHYSYQGNDKTGLGILAALFLGVIGLIIGLLVYIPSYERETFINAWLKTYLITRIISLIIVFTVCCYACNTVLDLY